jgi:hypothetical protein
VTPQEATEFFSMLMAWLWVLSGMGACLFALEVRKTRRWVPISAGITCLLIGFAPLLHAQAVSYPCDSVSGWLWWAGMCFFY